MRLVCPTCNARYNVADTLVAGRNFRVSCKECGTLIRSAHTSAPPPPGRHGGPPGVRRPSSLPPPRDTLRVDTSPRKSSLPPPPGARRADGKPPLPEFIKPRDGEAWFTIVGGSWRGPFTARQIGDQLDSGLLSWNDDVWRHGLKDWKPARRDAVLVTAVASASGRGRVGDTLKLEANTSFLAGGSGEDTVVDEALGRAVRERAAPSSGTQRLDSASDTQLMHEDELALEASGAASLPAYAPTAPAGTPSAWSSPQNQAFRSALGMPPDSSRIPVAPVTPTPHPLPVHERATLAAAFRSAPALMATASSSSAAPAGASVRRLPRARAGRPRGAASPWYRSVGGIAAASFAGGMIVAALFTRAAERTQRTPVQARPPAAAAVSAPAPAAPRPASASALHLAQPARPPEKYRAQTLRELPEPSEIRGALRQVSQSVRRCLSDVRAGVDLAIHIDGPEGRVRDVSVRRPALPPGRAQCVRHAVRRMRLEPFARPELRLQHRFAWPG